MARPFSSFCWGCGGGDLFSLGCLCDIIFRMSPRLEPPNTQVSTYCKCNTYGVYWSAISVKKLVIEIVKYSLNSYTDIRRKVNIFLLRRRACTFITVLRLQRGFKI